MVLDAPVLWERDTIEIDGVSLARFRHGPANGRPILLVHGLGHWTQAAWDHLVPALDPTLRLTSIDLPGFGASDRPDSRYDLPFFARMIDGVAQQSLPERFAILGHSLGGMVAADTAARRPDAITALALLAPAGIASAPRFIVRALGSPLAGSLFNRRPSRRFVERTLRRAVRDPHVIPAHEFDEAFALSQDAALRRAFAGVYRGAIQAMLDQPALHAHFARYSGPVFVGWGRHDAYISVKALTNARRIYPQATTRVYESSAHLTMVEQPLDVARDLNAFLASNA